MNNVDNCVLLDDNSVAFIMDIIQQNSILYIRVQQFLSPNSFFTTPCDSKNLGIFYISSNNTSNIIQVPVTQIKKKCFKIQYFNEVGSYVTIPLLHCDKIQSVP